MGKPPKSGKEIKAGKTAPARRKVVKFMESGPFERRLIGNDLRKIAKNFPNFGKLFARVEAAKTVLMRLKVPEKKAEHAARMIAVSSIARHILEHKKCPGELYLAAWEIFKDAAEDPGFLHAVHWTGEQGKGFVHAATKVGIRNAGLKGHAIEISPAIEAQLVALERHSETFINMILGRETLEKFNREIEDIYKHATAE